MTFDSVYRAVHGRTPFLWQQRAADELTVSGWWRGLTAPTGAGKTTLIDCWLHALTIAGPDVVGRRLFWVVDRRAVVDQVADYAEAVIAALCSTKDLVAHVQYERLRTIGGGRPPTVVVWRGGLDDDARATMRAPLDPARVTIVCSTLDQLGSRLLFRGYGIGTRSRALHAGLVGLDSVVVLDEAHLADAFRETVAAVGALQQGYAETPKPPVRLLPITATPLSAKTGWFELNETEAQQETISRRFRAAKKIRLLDAADAANAAIDLAGDDPSSMIGVVLNTVASARATFEHLVAARGHDNCLLIIGPVRTLERGYALARVPDRTTRVSRTKPLFVIATQTIEVGVDLDFDGLVTACAPTPSLVQRLGRLDRAGDLGASNAVILPPPPKGCPVYGTATQETWQWLGELPDAALDDFGPAGLKRIFANHPPPRSDEPPHPPILREADVSAFTVIDGRDEETPAVDLFLHGDVDVTADVTLVWRSDMNPSLAPEEVAERISLRPIHPGEGLSLSLRAVERWLKGATLDAMADVMGIDEPPELGKARQASATRSAWRVDRQTDDPVDVELLADGRGRLRPGDTIVVAAASGGIDAFGWAPASRRPADDLGSLDKADPRIVLRSDELVRSDNSDVRTVVADLEDGLLDSTAAALILAPLVRAALPDGSEVYAVTARIDEVVSAFASGDRGRAMVVNEGAAVVLSLARRNDRRRHGGRVTLDDHQNDVWEHLASTVATLGLPPDVVTALELAARHHDEGKRDERFQQWLTGGSVTADPLAKSTYLFTRRRSWRLREAAGWPEGKRHEIASAIFAKQARPQDALLHWIVATHHGRNRPFVAAVADPAGANVEITASLEGATRVLRGDALLEPHEQLSTMTELTERFGPWGLAYLEALLMIADRFVTADGR